MDAQSIAMIYSNTAIVVGIILAAAAFGSALGWGCLLYTSPSPRDLSTSRMPSSA